MSNLPTRALARRATGVAMAAITTFLLQGAPASATAASEPPVAGTYCTPWEGHYGAKNWTYADARVCLVVDASQKAHVRGETDTNTYYWGGAWYNASSNYPANWRATGTVSNSKGKVLSYDTYLVSQTSRAGSKDDMINVGTLSECGEYTVSMRFFQNGAYWTDSPSIDSGERTYQIAVPCS